MSESENDPSSAIVAMLALSSDKMPKPSVVADALRIRLPDGPLPEHVEGDEGTITFHLGSAIAAISLMPVPLPWSELESPCTTAWWWPDAAEEMRDHKQHIIVALIGGEETLLSRHVLLSQLVAAVAAADQERPQPRPWLLLPNGHRRRHQGVFHGADRGLGLRHRRLHAAL